MKPPMMKCGHAANGVTMHSKKPCCVICAGIHPGAYEVNDNPPSLEGRKAVCTYSPRHGVVDSSTNLPFFEHLPDRLEDWYYCGCQGWD